MEDQLHILIIDDAPADYASFRKRYGQEHKIKLVGDVNLGISQAENQDWSVALVDLDFGKGYEEGLARVVPAIVKNAKNKYPVIVITSDASSSTRDIVLQIGAKNIIWKGDIYDEKLMYTIKEAIRNYSTNPKEAFTKPPVEQAVPVSKKRDLQVKHIGGMITQSPRISALQKRWELLVNYTDKPVLLLGETGVGKELAARYIYDSRGDKNLPYEAVNLKAFNKDLLLSELFGHVKGAFTGANQEKVGFFEKIGKGTLFIDEIGEISENIQVQLLRVLETRIYQRVGDTTSRKLEAQLVFATNKDLKEAIADGSFREDFFQRISALSFTIPPLRERPEDIVLLINHFLSAFCHAYHPLLHKTAEEAFTAEALQRIQSFPWPANVRELRNEIQRLVFEADAAQFSQIKLDMLAGRFKKRTPTLDHNKEDLRNKEANKDGLKTEVIHTDQWPLKKAIAYEELKRIETALIQEAGHKHNAAIRLGMKGDDALRYRVQKKYYSKYPELFPEFRTIRKVYGLD